MPSPGYLIFFDWDNGRKSDHVGIVEKFENNSILTIEENCNDEYRGKKYNYMSKNIFEYGVLTKK
ncbi:CHAP domain-containing protein [Longibaculum muris]|uniref:CHAP domain-containing protein n=1 Tax=Longibaculum muris TaxID=1796628 RepID=UPI0037C9C731